MTILRLRSGRAQGSTAYTVNGTTKSGEERYYPWDTDRFTSSGQTITSYKFTGQREEAGIGLYYYGTRWYDPRLARFIRVPLGRDTLVPNPGDAQSFDRYAYANNNPLKYVDPNGHCPAASVPGGTTEENQAAWYENARCTALVNTILNAWDKTDYWKKLWPDKEAFKKYLGDSPIVGHDFFLFYWKEYQVYEKQWNALQHRVETAERKAREGDTLLPTSGKWPKASWRCQPVCGHFPEVFRGLSTNCGCRINYS